MKIRWRMLLVAAVAGGLAAASAGQEVTLVQSDDRVRVEIGGALFTEYVFRGGPRPYLHPVLAADGTPLTRGFPMKTGGAGEEEDHPHHRSLWFTHGDVNGIDFWTERRMSGTIVNETVTTSTHGGTGTLRARNRWVAPSGVVVLTDETTVVFRADPEGRIMDYEVTLRAPAEQAVVLGDTKEGSMAIRVAPWMTAPHTFKGKMTDTRGEIVNAEGLRNGDTWGKRAKWVDYHGPKDGKVYGVAMFDHPQNPRHPTWWHVRDYGLFAANPFGRHDFEPEHKGNPAAGNLTVPAGGSVTFRWRFYFHEGDERAARVAERYEAFALRK